MPVPRSAGAGDDIASPDLSSCATLALSPTYAVSTTNVWPSANAKQYEPMVRSLQRHRLLAQALPLGLLALIEN